MLTKAFKDLPPEVQAKIKTLAAEISDLERRQSEGQNFAQGLSHRIKDHEADGKNTKSDRERARQAADSLKQIAQQIAQKHAEIKKLSVSSSADSKKLDDEKKKLAELNKQSAVMRQRTQSLTDTYNAIRAKFSKEQDPAKKAQYDAESKKVWIAMSNHRSAADKVDQARRNLFNRLKKLLGTGSWSSLN